MDTPPTVEKRKALAEKDLEINGESKEPSTKRQKTGLRQKTLTLCLSVPSWVLKLKESKGDLLRKFNFFQARFLLRFE